VPGTGCNRGQNHTFLVHIHRLYLPSVEDLNRDLVPGEHMLGYLDLRHQIVQ
jgi:hypothetical protein